MNNRDVDADYKAALIQEHDGYKRAGRDEDAEAVAEVLSEQYGHDVGGKKRRTAKKAAAPERADQKAPEQAVPEKPQARAEAGTAEGSGNA